MKEKLRVFLLFILLFALGISSALAASDYCVVPLDTENTHALLLKNEEHNYIIGGSDAETILRILKDQSINDITAVIVPCSHNEHISAVQALCEQFQAAAVARPELPQSESTDYQWLEEGVVFSDSKNRFAFGAGHTIDGSICYQCDGTLLAFKATTNEASVNIRDIASTSGKRVAKLARGTVITVQGSLLNEKNELWYRVVSTDGSEGFIRSDLLQYISEEEISVLTAEQSKSTKSENRYIGNKNSKVFHRPSCGSLPSGKNQVYFDSRSYAVSKGYKPCSKCDP